MDAVVTGIFTIAGVVVTAVAALAAAWMKYKTDRRQELRRERRDVYERFLRASVNMWDTLDRVRRPGDSQPEPLPEALDAANNALVGFGTVYGELSLVAAEEVWAAAEPMFNEMRSAFFARRLPSGPADNAHDAALRALMRRDLGR